MDNETNKKKEEIKTEIKQETVKEPIQVTPQHKVEINQEIAKEPVQVAPIQKTETIEVKPEPKFRQILPSQMKKPTVPNNMPANPTVPQSQQPISNRPSQDKTLILMQARIETLKSQFSDMLSEMGNLKSFVDGQYKKNIEELTKSVINSINGEIKSNVNALLNDYFTKNILPEITTLKTLLINTLNLNLVFVKYIELFTWKIYMLDESNEIDEKEIGNINQKFNEIVSETLESPVNSPTNLKAFCTQLLNVLQATPE